MRYLITRVDLARSTNSAQLTNNLLSAVDALYKGGSAVYDLQTKQQITTHTDNLGVLIYVPIPTL